MPLPHDPGPHWGEVGIHGLHRHREWDALTTVDAPGHAGVATWFVVLDTGEIVQEEGDADPSPFVPAITLAAPFRVHAVRREGGLWVVATRRIATYTLLEDPGGDAVVVAWDGVERTVLIDGAPTLAGVPELERLGAARHATYVVAATRLVRSVWEASVAPL
ncbi:MAG: hypothetical protein M5U27_00780 [Gaiella sp.]|nr:hypothetical protein [Gaiella sp.]